ncbi:MAG TPA: hypothetical protein VMW72_21010 [Sedimentisphaerales bacterium]|nr:hypothetical protein [Sedimentisphaerales bacterium]
MTKNTKFPPNFVMAMCFLISISSLAAEPSRPAHLSAEELLDLYESTYSKIHNWHVLYTNMLEETKGDSPELQSYVRFDTTETIEEEACEKYYVRWTNDPNGFDPERVVEKAFDGSATTRYQQYGPYYKTGEITPGSSVLAGEQMCMLWSYMLLNRRQPHKHPDEPLIRSYFSDKSRVRPQLEQVSGEWCHVVDSFSPGKSKPYDTVWFAADRGGLPMKFERRNRPGYTRRIIVTKVGSVETDTGKIWYPEQATKEVNDRDGYRLYRFKVQSLKVNIETNPETFKVSFPTGTNVIDKVAGIYYTTGASSEKKYLGVLKAPTQRSKQRQRIEIYKPNPAYWQYKGKPVLLIGGTKDDNLFQIPDLKEHLDLLKSVGGNYVRNTMSSRDEGNVWPFQKVSDKYDLNQWNEEYWRRFENFLKLMQERDIIVQIEVWATFDYYRDNWVVNPFNPKNNINYTAKQTGLPEQVDTHPTRTENNFFWSVPAERNQKTVLKYQRRFVDKILSYSLRFGNVLYCMDNETSVTPEWGKYWSEYIKAGAKTAGVAVQTTEMWDKWDLAHPQHNPTFDHPETYSFVDISQNNHQKGQTHWDNAQRQRARIADNIRPLNNVKIYGADTGRFGNDRDGMERFWRNIFGGLASARFHRPDSGLGLGEKAQANIRSMWLITDKMNVFKCAPGNDLLSERESNEAYCLANPGTEYAVYFPDGGEVTLDISALKKPATVRWLNIMKCQWSSPKRIEGQSKLVLRCPSRDYWAVLVQ